MIKMTLAVLLNEIRKEHPNAVAREDSYGIYFDLTGDEYPEDEILDVTHNIYLRD